MQENYDIFNISFYYYKDVDVYSLFISHNLLLNTAPLVGYYLGAAIINSVTEALQHAQKNSNICLSWHLAYEPHRLPL